MKYRFSALILMVCILTGMGSTHVGSSATGELSVTEALLKGVVVPAEIPVQIGGGLQAVEAGESTSRLRAATAVRSAAGGPEASPSRLHMLYRVYRI